MMCREGLVLTLRQQLPAQAPLAAPDYAGSNSRAKAGWHPNTEARQHADSAAITSTLTHRAAQEHGVLVQIHKN